MLKKHCRTLAESHSKPALVHKRLSIYMNNSINVDSVALQCMSRQCQLASNKAHKYFGNILHYVNGVDKCQRDM